MAAGPAVAHPSPGRGRLSSARGKRPPSGGQLAGMGVSIAVALIVPLLLGVGVDALLHTSPLGVLIGLLVGIVASCYTAYSRFRPSSDHAWAVSRGPVDIVAVV